MHEPEIVEHVADAENSLVCVVRDALGAANAGLTKLPEPFLRMQGMSGRKYRIFINELISRIIGASYLEVGSWTGSTLCAAIHGNNVEALAIDNWTQFGSPGQSFFYNLAHALTPDARASFLHRDFREVPFEALGKHVVYFFDGPHDEVSQRDGVMMAQPALEDEYVLVVDDWNWSGPRVGTNQALKALNAQVLYSWQIRTTQDESHGTPAGAEGDWHNGYAVFVVRKNG
jgi:hypothetical protein